jgi:hypothetical protein
MTQDEYTKQFNEEDSVGWMAIDQQLKTIYPSQKERHYAPPIHYMIGGNDPIDGSSIYDNEEQTFHRHIISYGMSELYYSPDKAGGDFSKWGFEFTFRIVPFAGDKADPLWAVALMNNLARYVFDSGRWFEAYEFIPANGPIRLETDTDIVGLAFAPDPQLGKIDTPHGELTFLQLVGLTTKELKHLQDDPTMENVKKLINEMKAVNPLLITDLNRRD